MSSSNNSEPLSPETTCSMVKKLLERAFPSIQVILECREKPPESLPSAEGGGQVKEAQKE